MLSNIITDRAFLTMFSLAKIFSFLKPRTLEIVENNTVNPELGESRIVYVQDLVPDRDSQLYTLDLQTGRADLVGAIASNVYDLAFAGSRLYGLKQSNNDTQLVEIDRATGEATSIGNIGFEVVGLAYNYQREMLYATAAKQLITLNLQTGKGTPVISVSKDQRVCGEIAFDDSGKAYITLIAKNRKKQLASCDLDRGKAKVIGNTGFPDLASMEFVNNVLYGVTGNFFDLGKDGRLLRIDTKTGKGTVISQTTPISRWAGITVAAVVPASNVEEPTNNNSDSETFKKEKQMQPINNVDSKTGIEEKQMQLLTIDTKANCYVIDPNGMNSLQENVASKITLNEGNYKIQITSENYNSNNAEEEKPAVLLWIYGTDDSTFINKKTGVETGATWSTLNGRHQTLELEVKQQAVVCALFFRVGNEEINNRVELTITSDSSDSRPQQLIVDSRNNCYSLDGQYLSSLKQWDNNFIELEPGNYSLRIQKANASYWSEEEKFNLEPWALIWIEKGSFVTDFGGMEVSESWCSLNGFRDEVRLKVESKTTLSGFFFDTYKEDNQGQITIAIKTLAEEAFPEPTPDSEISVPSGRSLNFRFDLGQMESTWREMAVKIGNTLTVTDEQDPEKEALYWDNLEKSLLKGYQSQAKGLAMQVARLEFMMKFITEQTQVGFSQSFEAWSDYFNKRLDNSISNRRITTIVDERINRQLEEQTNEIEKRVEERINEKVEREIDTRVDRKVTELSQKIEKQITEKIEAGLDRRINENINTIINRRISEIEETVTARLEANIDERVGNLIDRQITEQGHTVKEEAIAEIRVNLNTIIGAVVEPKLIDLTIELKDEIIQEVRADVDARIETAIDSRTNNLEQKIQESLKAFITEELKSSEAIVERNITEKIDVTIDEQFTDIKNRVINEVKIDRNKEINNVVNFRIGDLSSRIKKEAIEQIKLYSDRKIDAVVNEKVINFKLEIDNLITNGITGNVDKRIEAVVNQKTNALRQNIKNLVIQQIEPYIDLQIKSVVDKSTANTIDMVVNQFKTDIDDRIQVNFDDRIDYFRNDLTTTIANEINRNNKTIIPVIIDDRITGGDFYLNLESIKTEVNNFFARLGQFETNLNLRIKQGDTELRNWTLEQLTALQGCLSDRQTLSDMFAKFASELRDELDNADCVQPTRFTSWATTEQNIISPAETPQLPGS